MTEAGVNVMEGDKSKESDGEFGDLCHVSDSKNRKPISLKSDFLRTSRIGRHSRKIDFSFISPKHTFG